MSVVIKNLDSVLLPAVLQSDKKISCVQTNYLTVPGENYGSILLSLEITLQEIKNGKNKTISCVAKTVPKNDFIKNFFISSLTFKKELYFYSTVVPALNQFKLDEEMKLSLNFTAEFLGGRISMDPTLDKADEDAVILLENLKTQGYKIVNRVDGYDLDTACLIIKDLAVLHALCIAVKIKRPDVFAKKVLPSLERADVFQSISEEMRKRTIEDVINIARENPECVQYLNDIKRKCENCFANISEPKCAREPFATLTHNDLWVNNTMIKFNENGKPTQNKIIDFQFTSYDSPGKDLLFLIFDSVQNNIIEKHFDTLVKLYHETFITTLGQAKMDTSEFSFANFLLELDHAAKNTFVICQCFVMLRPIFAVEEAVFEVERLNHDNILQYKTPLQQHKEKLYLIVKEFAKRNWI